MKYLRQRMYHICLILVPLFYGYFCDMEPAIYQCINLKNGPLVLIFGVDGPEMPLNTPKCFLEINYKIYIFSSYGCQNYHFWPRALRNCEDFSYKLFATILRRSNTSELLRNLTESWTLTTPVDVSRKLETKLGHWFLRFMRCFNLVLYDRMPKKHETVIAAIM